MVDQGRSLIGMRTLLAALALVSLVAPAAAEERTEERGFRWSKMDTALEIAVVASLAVDYLQTRQLMRDGLESNQLLAQGGISPSAYFVTAAAAHVIVSLALPEGKWRTAFQGVVLGAEINAIENNWTAGYGLRF